jgi:penicillin-binding protein 2
MKSGSDTQPSIGRLILATLVVCAAFTILIFRLWYLQCMNGAYYRDQSENNRTRTIRTVAPRGTVYDRENRVLVHNRPAFNVELMIEDTPNIGVTLDRLSGVTGHEKSELEQSLGGRKTRRHFEPQILLEDISRTELARVKANSYKLPGVIINPIPTRYYPYNNLGSQIFGYTREISKAQLESDPNGEYSPGDVVGQSGIEKTWEPTLRGKSGFVRVEVDAMGKRKGELGIADDRPGKDIFLTIDLDLQQTAEKNLEGKRGAVVALDPNNGEVLALASAPTFDANIFSGRMLAKEWNSLREDKSHPLTNRAIASTFAPGSTFKLIMASAALAMGKITPNTKLNCPGYYFFAGRAYKCHKHSGHGVVDLKKAITVSCNAYFYQVGQMLGVDSIHKFATAMGLGKPTGIDLPGEESGIIPSSEWKQQTLHDKWYEGETLSVAIGQGYDSVTPLQMAVAFSTIANGGKVYRPHIVRKVIDPATGEEELRSPTLERTLPVDPKVFETVRIMATEVVSSKDGTGRRAALPGILVSGKTGTAQVKALSVRGKDERFNDHAWFVSMAPAEKPMIVIATIVENGGHGGVTAAPISKEVMEVFFRKKGMLPPPEAEVEQPAKQPPAVVRPPQTEDEPSEGTGDDDDQSVEQPTAAGPADERPADQPPAAPGPAPAQAATSHPGGHVPRHHLTAEG